MIKRYNIRVKYGDEDKLIMLYFVHKEYQNLSISEQDLAFDAAVKELNHIYKTYGRFATLTGVTRLFNTFGFDRTIP